MRLTAWASAPLTHRPPPVPFSTDVVNTTNPAYRVGAIPALAIADDLAAAGLTYRPGRGNGYARHGQPFDRYAVGDVIAEVFDDAATVLRYFIETDSTVLAVEAAEARVRSIPFRDTDDPVYTASRASAVAARDHAAARLTVSREQLLLTADSFAATARSVRGVLFVREEAIRRFRVGIPSPRHSRQSSPAEIDAFLGSYSGVVPRTALPEDATAAGLRVGSRTLYAAADALGWHLVKRRGDRYYRVPEARL